jgi:glycosyltransferase involved in cell wall biosynthesis
VLIHGYRHWLSYWGATYAARLNLPYILHLHGMATRLFRSKLKKRVFDIVCGRAMVRRCAGIVFSSQVEYQGASEVLTDIRRHWVIPNPVESAVRHDHLQARSRWNTLLGLDPACPLVVSIGRVNRTKNFNALIDALNGGRPFNLIIAGPPEEPNYWRQLEDAARRLSNSRVVMLPGIYGGEKHSLLAAADVFATTSMLDSFNLTVAEALFQGTPCVYPVWLGVHEHLDSRLCVPISSVEKTALTSALHRALQIPRLPAGTVDPFNWNTLLPRFEKVFMEVCQPLHNIVPYSSGGLT